MSDDLEYLAAPQFLSVVAFLPFLHMQEGGALMEVLMAARNWIAGGALGAVMAITTSAGAATLINGSFETNTLTPAQAAMAASQGYVTLSKGSKAITGWTVNGGSIDYIGSYWKAAQGSWSLDMSGNTNGSITQSFATTPGQTYDVTFDLAGNPDGSPTNKDLGVDAGGSPISLYGFDSAGATHSNMGWTPESYVFQATGALSSLTFTSLDTPNTPYGPALDNISISAVPEAATWMMMLLGAGLLGAGLRLSRRQEGAALAAV